MATTKISNPVVNLINALNSQNEITKLLTALKTLKKKSDNDLSNLLINERSIC